MKIVLNRVSFGSIRLQGKPTIQIGKGILLLVGVERGDTPEMAQGLARKIAQMRIFEDDQGKMNLAPLSVGAEVLVVPQFTLAADLTHGNRPSFDPAELPDRAKVILNHFVYALKAMGLAVQEAPFGTKMDVEMVNHGPATFIIS